MLCQCNRTKLFKKWFYAPRESLSSRSHGPPCSVCNRAGSLISFGSSLRPIWQECGNPLLFQAVVYCFNQHPPFHHPSHAVWRKPLPLPGGLPAPICSTRTSQIVSVWIITGPIFQFRAHPWSMRGWEHSTIQIIKQNKCDQLHYF